jgi:cobalt-zinc-cadmium efflux system outer membrane protein
MRFLWLGAVALAACVPSRSSLFDPVSSDVQRRVGLSVVWTEDARTDAAIATLLARPLDADTAVRIALARNRRLQASYDQLGIAGAAVAEAAVLPPVSVDIDRKFGVNGGSGETELEAVQDVLDLFQIGQRRTAANAELAAARARAVAATVQLASDVEQAFDDLVAAQQDEELVKTAFAAAEASADLVERQHAAGNTTDLALEREREQRERMRVEVMRAGLAITEKKARLAALMGIGESRHDFTASGRLPELPAETPKLDDLGAAATSASLESTALRAEADAAAARHRYAVVRAFLPELGVGVSAARRESPDWEVGPTLRFGLPLFNQQQGPRARSLAEEKRARDELAATAAELAAEADAARARVQVAYDEVKQLRDVVLPMRQRILDQTVLQYNAMNASTFELLSARRDMVDVGRQYIDALRRYWRAMADVKALQRGAGHARMIQEGTP